MFRKIAWLILFLLCSNPSFAGELIGLEAAKYFDEGVKAQKGGELESAIISYHKVLVVDPNNRDWQKYIANNLGVIYAQEGGYRIAEDYFNKALTIDPLFNTAKLNLGFIYDKQRSELESIKYWLKVLNIDLGAIKPKELIVQEVPTEAQK
ncbi:MAG: hypothetical protein FJZ15_07195 [Candidatus Omnitrophica bacterium]|nr:hypothetical protein [Candidatus Omnitrophota bacterium]